MLRISMHFIFIVLAVFVVLRSPAIDNNNNDNDRDGTNRRQVTMAPICFVSLRREDRPNNDSMKNYFVNDNKQTMEQKMDK